MLPGGFSEPVSDCNITANFDMFDRINIEGKPSGTSNKQAAQTQISVRADQTTTVINEAGQNLTYDYQTGQTSGNMNVRSINHIPDSNPPIVIFEVGDSNRFDFKTDNNAEVSVVGKDYYCSAKAEKAQSIEIDGNSGVRINGTDTGKVSASLGVNNQLGELIAIEGNSKNGAALQKQGDNILVEGLSGKSDLTRISNTADIELLEFTSKDGRALIIGEDGTFDVRVSSNNNDVFDKSVLRVKAPTAPSWILILCIALGGVIVILLAVVAFILWKKRKK